MYEAFFQSISFPVFLIELNSDSAKSKPYKLNIAATNLLKTCNTNFYKGSHLEKFDGFLKEFISSIRSNNKEVYSDVIHIPLANGPRAAYSLIASTFEIEAEIKILGIVLLEISKTIKEQIKILANFKASLSTSLSHELNNPINSLIPLLEMMPSYVQGEGKKDIKEMALSNAHLLQNKVKDFIDYTKIGTKNIKIRPTQFYLEEIFDELKRLFEVEIESNINRFIVKIVTYTCKRLMIFTDKDRLKQVLIKLVSNANKFTSKGSIFLTAKEVKENFNICFIVKDTGIGIPKEKQELLFASLIQKSEKAGEVGGLPGLGLEIAKGLCKHLGAILTFTSEEGRGTIFTFEIPECHILTLEDMLNTKAKQSDEEKPNKKKIDSLCTESHKTKLYTPKKPLRDKNLLDEKQVINTNPIISTVSNKNVLDKEAEVCKRMKYCENFSTKDNTKTEECETAFIPRDDHITTKEKHRVVLVTDDAFYNRMVMKEMLKKFNVATIEASNGEEAAVIVEKSFSKDCAYEITLIFMDLNMPIMNGVESTIKIRQLKKEYERKEEIPIIAVTAHDSTKDRVGCIQAGMQEYQLKPVTRKQLEKLLKTYEQIS
jgi:signal transduction histidine kinase/ActR/RegA family two-component response regulator